MHDDVRINDDVSDVVCVLMLQCYVYRTIGMS